MQESKGLDISDSVERVNDSHIGPKASSLLLRAVLCMTHVRRFESCRELKGADKSLLLTCCVPAQQNINAKCGAPHGYR